MWAAPGVPGVRAHRLAVVEAQAARRQVLHNASSGGCGRAPPSAHRPQRRLLHGRPRLGLCAAAVLAHAAAAGLRAAVGLGQARHRRVQRRLAPLLLLLLLLLLLVGGRLRVLLVARLVLAELRRGAGGVQATRRWRCRRRRTAAALLLVVTRRLRGVDVHGLSTRLRPGLGLDGWRGRHTAAAGSVVLLRLGRRCGRLLAQQCRHRGLVGVWKR